VAARLRLTFLQVAPVKFVHVVFAYVGASLARAKNKPTVKMFELESRLALFFRSERRPEARKINKKPKRRKITPRKKVALVLLGF
jgi:hypothetical protein